MRRDLLCITLALALAAALPQHRHGLLERLHHRVQHHHSVGMKNFGDKDAEITLDLLQPDGKLKPTKFTVGNPLGAGLNGAASILFRDNGDDTTTELVGKLAKLKWKDHVGDQRDHRQVEALFQGEISPEGNVGSPFPQFMGEGTFDGAYFLLQSKVNGMLLEDLLIPEKADWVAFGKTTLSQGFPKAPEGRSRSGAMGSDGQDGARTTHALKKGLAQALEQLRTLNEAYSGFVHNDIKPDNIMWDDANQRITLIDFGEGCIEQSGHEETRNGGRLASAWLPRHDASSPLSPAPLIAIDVSCVGASQSAMGAGTGAALAFPYPSARADVAALGISWLWLMYGDQPAAETQCADKGLGAYTGTFITDNAKGRPKTIGQKDSASFDAFGQWIIENLVCFPGATENDRVVNFNRRPTAAAALAAHEAANLVPADPNYQAAPATLAHGGWTGWKWWNREPVCLDVMRSYAELLRYEAIDGASNGVPLPPALCHAQKHALDRVQRPQSHQGSICFKNWVDCLVLKQWMDRLDTDGMGLPGPGVWIPTKPQDKKVESIAAAHALDLKKFEGGVSKLVQKFCIPRRDDRTLIVYDLAFDRAIQHI